MEDSWFKPYHPVYNNAKLYSLTNTISLTMMRESTLVDVVNVEEEHEKQWGKNTPLPQHHHHQRKISFLQLAYK